MKNEQEEKIMLKALAAWVSRGDGRDLDCSGKPPPRRWPVQDGGVSCVAGCFMSRTTGPGGGRCLGGAKLNIYARLPWRLPGWGGPGRGRKRRGQIGLLGSQMSASAFPSATEAARDGTFVAWWPLRRGWFPAA